MEEVQVKGSRNFVISSEILEKFIKDNVNGLPGDSGIKPIGVEKSDIYLEIQSAEFSVGGDGTPIRIVEKINGEITVEGY